MKLKNILIKYFPLYIFFIILSLLFIALVVLDMDSIINRFFYLNWLTSFGVFLLGAKEMANLARLGFGLTRKAIHFEFMKRLINILIIFLFLWLSLIIILFLKEKHFILDFKLVNKIIWALAAIFMMGQIGLLLGFLRLKSLYAIIASLIMLSIFYYFEAQASFLISSLIFTGGIIITIINYRIIRNIKIFNFKRMKKK